MKVFVLIQEGIYKSCDEDATCQVFSTLELAQIEMERQYMKEVIEYNAHQLKDGENEFDYSYVATKDKYNASVYKAGWYCDTHECWTIYEKEVI